MIDEQYLSRAISMLVLCRMLLPSKSQTNRDTLKQFDADFEQAISFLFHVSGVLPYVRKLDDLGKLYVANGEVSMLDGENEADALLRWLKDNARPNKRRKTYH